MYIFNISFVVDHSIHTHWLEVVRKRFIPYLNGEGFSDTIFTRVLNNDNGESFTYSLQVAIDDLEHYQRLTGEIIGEYVEICSPVFGDRALHFCSLLKRVDV